jgi:CheY-like chemotaxis protein
MGSDARRINDSPWRIISLPDAPLRGALWARLRCAFRAATVSVLDETRTACEAAGMGAFITKPIRVDEIGSILKRFRV